MAAGIQEGKILIIGLPCSRLWNQGAGGAGNKWVLVYKRSLLPYVIARDDTNDGRKKANHVATTVLLQHDCGLLRIIVWKPCLLLFERLYNEFFITYYPGR